MSFMLHERNWIMRRNCPSLPLSRETELLHYCNIGIWIVTNKGACVHAHLSLAMELLRDIDFGDISKSLSLR